MLLFSNLMTGGPRGDLQRVNFTLNINMSTKIFRISKNFKVKFTLCKSPRGPPSSNLKKAISLVSLKNYSGSSIDFNKCSDAVQVGLWWSGFGFLICVSTVRRSNSCSIAYYATDRRAWFSKNIGARARHLLRRIWIQTKYSIDLTIWMWMTPCNWYYWRGNKTL